MKKCVRCRDVALDEGKGVVGEDVCGACAGRFLSPEITERVVVDELGLEREALREIANMFSGLRLPCPGCAALMKPLRLRGVVVDLCFSCGGLWLDAGELKALSGGRHGELGATPLPVKSVVDVAAGNVVLGRGACVVLFDDDRAVTQAQLQQAFARTDGLTSVDAQMLARNNHGVVVEGVSERGARGLKDVLAGVGVGASVVDDRVLRLPPPLQAWQVDVGVTDDGRAGLRARFHTGPALDVAFADVAAVAGARIQRERLERRASVVPALLRNVSHGAAPPLPETTPELVTSDDVILELLQVVPVTRRLRVIAPSTALVDAAAAATAVGRGVGAATWPRYRRLRELERELAWVAWRAARWPIGQQTS